MRWLALVFPDLALECLPGLAESADAWILTGQGRVFACNEAARQQGIHPGLGLSAAAALAPGLHQRARAPGDEAACLQALAEWALGFAAEVSLEETAALLLEIGSTQRYFGGLSVLLSRLHASLALRRHHYDWAVAPTPLAALWLARGTPGQILEDLAELPARLGRLPLRVTGLPEVQQQALQGVGVEALAEVFSLPAAALALRYGPQLPRLFERALGLSPDPRQGFQPPQHFARRVELVVPVMELKLLMAVVQRLIPELADWAWRNARVLTRVALVLEHERQAATQLSIGFAGTRTPSHLQLVIEERLQRCVLAHPVAALGLEILESERCTALADGLLPAPPARLREGQELLERLRARLGGKAVQGLAPYPDHRPERAWIFAEPGVALKATMPGGMAGPRPIWLLETPRDLGDGALPRLVQPLRLLTGPERIESGWWDGADMARDYFVAVGVDGPHYWVYRDCRHAAHWFLQGVFA
jgi:protein ImuB